MYRRSQSLIFLVAVFIAGQSAAELIDGEDFRDPTEPIVSAAPVREVESGGLFSAFAPSAFTLTFVRDSDTSPMAVINDTRVTIGDRINGALVVAIDRNGVTLRVNDEDSRINLFSTSVKSPVVQR